MKAKLVCLLSFVLLIVSCSTIKVLKYMGNEKVNPAEFNTSFPFTMPKNQSIHMVTYWGADHIERELKLDNHAPTAIDTSIANHTKGITWIGDIFVDKPLPDGRKIPNRFYLYSGMKLGAVSFDNIVINEIPSRNVRDTSIVPDDGLFGENLMQKGVWKIDFEHMEITFASRLDSLKGLDSALQVDAAFNNTSSITFKVTIAGNYKTTFDLDLGYNGALIVPKEDFDKIRFNAKTKEKTAHMTTVAGKQATKYYYVEKEKIQFGKQEYNAGVVANDLNKRKSLIGLKFFSAFKFIIIDYPGKKFYVSKELLHK